jgi:transcription initiation factor TFIIIB Brf1 subunit/transcription initiation factor TFIIB
MAKIPENPTPGRIWGRALRRTPDEIAKLSRVTDEDVGRAGNLWAKHAPRPLKTLLKKPRRKS